MRNPDPDPDSATPTHVAARSGRPWQVAVAVLLVAVWWVGSYATLIVVSGDHLGEDDVFPLIGVGLWSIVVFFLLRNTWRGGRASYFVAQVTLIFGGAYELTGLLTTLLWFFGATFLPLWTSILMAVVGTCPLVASKLLVTPTARAYAPKAWEGKRPEHLMTFLQFVRSR